MVTWLVPMKLFFRRGIDLLGGGEVDDDVYSLLLEPGR